MSNNDFDILTNILANFLTYDNKMTNDKFLSFYDDFDSNVLTLLYFKIVKSLKGNVVRDSGSFLKEMNFIKDSYIDDKLIIYVNYKDREYFDESINSKEVFISLFK